MISKYSLIFAAGSLFYLSTLASAGWQGTRWGMSLEDLRSIKKDVE